MHVSIPAGLTGRTQLFVRASVTLMLATSAGAQAETKAVGWGALRFDTAWSSQPFVEVDANGYFSVARRGDGTFAVWGYAPSGSAPALPPGVDYASVSAGTGHVAALRTDGVAVGWPAGSAPVASFPLSNVAELASGAGFTLVRFASGTVWAVGFNNYHINQVPTPPAGTTYVHVAAGLNHGLALQSDGVAVGWGLDSSGQASVPPPPPGRSFVELDGGQYHSLARLDDGSVIGWGLDSWGMLDVPPLPPGVTYVDVDAGPKHSLALRSDGAVVAWGNNFYGQCDVPALPPGMTYVQISAGGPYSSAEWGHNVALRSDGRLVGWGWNGYGQAASPELPPGASVAEVDTGCGGLDLGGPPVFPTTLLRLGDGSVIAWGDDSNGQLAVPPLPAGITYAAIAAGAGHNVALRSDGSLVDWGNGIWGQTSNTPAGQSFVEIAAGSYHSLARRSDGSVVAWGDPGAALPAPALPPGVTYVEIDCESFSLARRSDGNVVAWGFSNTYGQLNVPALPAGQTYVGIATGTYHGLALRSDGNVVVWGYNSLGSLAVPALPAGVTYVDIAASSNYAAALRSDGVVRVWGQSPGFVLAPPPLGPSERYVGLRAGANGLVALVEQPWRTYCTAKVNSLGCTPEISASGAPRASQSSGFTIACRSMRNQTAGLLFYAVNASRAATPFQCGLLCTTGALRRTPLQSSEGSPAATQDCTGVYSLDMNAFGAGAAGGSPDPALGMAGTLVHTQWWGRDGGFAAPCSTSLSDAIEYAIAP